MFGYFNISCFGTSIWMMEMRYDYVTWKRGLVALDWTATLGYPFTCIYLSSIYTIFDALLCLIHFLNRCCYFNVKMSGFVNAEMPIPSYVGSSWDGRLRLSRLHLDID